MVSKCVLGICCETYIVEHVWIEEGRCVDVWQGGGIADFGWGTGGDEEEVAKGGGRCGDEDDDEGEEEHADRLLNVVVVYCGVLRRETR